MYMLYKEDLIFGARFGPQANSTLFLYEIRIFFFGKRLSFLFGFQITGFTLSDYFYSIIQQGTGI